MPSNESLLYRNNGPLAIKSLKSKYWPPMEDPEFGTQHRLGAFLPGPLAGRREYVAMKDVENKHLLS
jgi:hypothetical protein